MSEGCVYYCDSSGLAGASTALAAPPGTENNLGVSGLAIPLSSPTLLTCNLKSLAKVTSVYYND